MNLTAMRVLLSMASLAFTLAVDATALPVAGKAIALVQAANCDVPQLRQKMQTATQELVKDRHTTRVVVDWPADPERNLDLMGRPSPIAVALELTAAHSALSALAERVQRALGDACSVGVYLVHERRFVVTPRSWPLGQPSPDVKVLNMLVRKQGLSLEDFAATWAGPHAELALSWRKVDGATGGHYVQNLVVERIGRDAPAFDGIGEGEGPHAASEREREARMKAAQHTPEFVDTSKLTMFVTREVILKD
jgi:hypothetical protein